MRRVDSTPEGAFPRPFGTKYVLLRHLATGGMADVFLARQGGLGGFEKECVIKRILPALASDQQFVTMFLDEARLCARLNHPNIAQVYDLGQVGADYFIAMEHVHGVDLERVLEVTVARGEQRLPYGVAARIVASIADGLEHAHNAADASGRPLGIVHRDVTPSNVVVSFEGVPKLLDFGIAKATTQRGRTEVGVVKGKAPYMSPEQVQGEPLDGRSDLFSLGAILFELTTGVKAWSGDNAAQVGIRILHDDPTPPALLMSDYPESLEAIVMAALAKRAVDRIATGRALQFRLERFLVESGQHVTPHEVAHFLAERFPKERARLSLVGAHDHPVLQENPTMSERPIRPTGPLTIGDPSSVIGELPADRGYDPGRRGGGGKWIAIVIAILVAATGILLFLLRGYEMKKEAQTPPPPTDQPVVTPPPTVVDEKKPSPPPIADEKKPIAPPVVDEKKPAAAPVKDEPKVTPIAPPVAVEPKPEPKHHHHSSSPAHHEGKPPALPHLPGAPPPTEE